MTPCYFTSNCGTGIFPHPYTHRSLRPQPFADRHLRIIRSLPLSPYPSNHRYLNCCYYVSTSYSRASCPKLADHQGSAETRAQQDMCRL